MPDVDCFNPCCSGSVSGGERIVSASFPVFGFNPCCSGSVSEAFDGETFTATANLVSILVVVDQFPEAFDGETFTATANLVSILVVVDQFPEETTTAGTTSYSMGFNPCCSGSVSGGILGCHQYNPASRFNPCCSGSVSGGLFFSIPLFSIYGFNPCCSGSVSGGRNQKWGIIRADIVSILVVVDQFPEEKLTFSRPPSSYRFQSLL